MFLLQDTVVVSATDITQAGMCEFAFLRKLDAKLGREVTVPALEDSMLERAARLGDAHEDRQLARYRADYGADRVAEIDRPAEYSAAGLSQREAETVAALRCEPEIVFQATFFDPQLRPGDAALPTIGFVGFADFLRRTAPGVWQVQDTKLARQARVPALLQIAAYGEQLTRLGFTPDDEAVLLLGDGSASPHRLADIAPVYRSRRERLIELIDESWQRLGADGSRATGAITPWGDPATRACGRCEVCEPEVAATRDPLLVAGMRLSQRNRLIDAGITTIDALAHLASTEGVRDIPGVSAAVLTRLALQAEVQVESERTGIPAVQVTHPQELAAIPEPNPGDLFFDFEGDPLYREVDASGEGTWGLDYLFGMIDTEGSFTPLWAHTLEEEREALEQFLALVNERRQQYPGMKIYHYAPYERTHLLSIAVRHGIGEAEVDDLLRDHVLIDLYPIVRKALRIGSRSYSIKKLEPLYMGDELRDEDGVTDGAQSVAEYAHAASLRLSEDPADAAEAARILDSIADYNRYDCVSTLRLRDWLLGIARDHGITPAPIHQPEPTGETPRGDESALGTQLLELAEEEDDPDEARALRLAASAIDYHQREQKSFWWAHFARLVDPVEDWADTRDVLVAERALTRLTEDWHKPPRARVERRHLLLRGTIAPGSSMKADGEAFALYEPPVPFDTPGQPYGVRGARRVSILERLDTTATGIDGVIIQENLGKEQDPYDGHPIALTPGPPPNAGQQKVAIEEWGTSLADAHTRGTEFLDPVYDLIRRTPPRMLTQLTAPDSAEALAAVRGNEDERMIGAVTASLRQLDRSYLAVQGPPGTGKTYLASRVIKRLVEENGWLIGVVAQSHKVVENVLDGVVGAGVDPRLVGKTAQRGASTDGPEPEWTVLPYNGHGAFLREHRESGRGAVVGGTAWDFSNGERIGRRELDLLVIDEAGQFSLAPTIASSVAADRLLLLGDPQQLPQVSQGSHPEPVDTSALGWLIGDRDTLPDTFGYFLEETRRMHPALARIDSALSYAGRLHAHESASDRLVDGHTEPGLIWHPVHHVGNATHSSEEAGVVVQIVHEALAATVTEPGKPVRELTEDDLIVVAAYNAQVECVSLALQAAGHPSVRVGTVDKFQGQEALIAIVTLAASSPDEVPRGLDFLLMRNRLNVAISRAQWCAHLVSSTALGGAGLPTSPAEVTALAGYLTLVESATARDVSALNLPSTE